MALKPFVFTTASRILFGYGSLSKLPEEAAQLGKRVLLVTGGSSLEASGHRAAIVRGLEERGLDVAFCEGVEAEPSVGTLQKGIDLFREAGCDLVVSVGGGSVMDIGKAVACLSASDRTAQAYFDGEPITRAGSPNIAVPTTSGTGSEVTKVSVLSDHESGRKASIRHDAMMPALALVDPELTFSCPPSVTAASGMDAFCQAIESYTSIRATPLTDAIALEAVRLTGRAVERAVENGADREAREEMALGSLMAGIALGNARLGLVHGIAHPVGILYDIPHGVACAMLLPPVMAYNMEASRAKCGRAAAELGLIDGPSRQDGAEKLLEFVAGLNRRFGIPERLSDLGAERSDFAHILKDGMVSGSTQSNPRPVDEAGFLEVLESVF
ncbi:MAG: iron-containing alcohol dehydrogenase [Armatimonadetes bacterium]|nr:iron-containing alcohol dehydrogenase [Armatimonadota bacterium]